MRVIVVVGGAALDGVHGEPAGVARIAVEAARHGARVELLSRIGDDAAGDRLVLELARRGVGHVAVLREARATNIVPSAAAADPDRSATEELLGWDVARPEHTSVPSRLDAHDIALGLAYLAPIEVVVIDLESDPGSLEAAVAGAEFHGAHVLALVGNAEPATMSAAVTAVQVPNGGGDPVVASVVATVAVAIAAGQDPSSALKRLAR